MYRAVMKRRDLSSIIFVHENVWNKLYAVNVSLETVLNSQLASPRCVKICNYSSLWEFGLDVGEHFGERRAGGSFAGKRFLRPGARAVERYLTASQLREQQRGNWKFLFALQFIIFHYRAGGVTHTGASYVSRLLGFPLASRHSASSFGRIAESTSSVFQLPMTLFRRRRYRSRKVDGEPREMWQWCTNDRGRWRISD